MIIERKCRRCLRIYLKYLLSSYIKYLSYCRKINISLATKIRILLRCSSIIYMVSTRKRYLTITQKVKLILKNRYLQQSQRNEFFTHSVSNTIWIYYIAGDLGSIGVLGVNVSDISNIYPFLVDTDRVPQYCTCLHFEWIGVFDYLYLGICIFQLSCFSTPQIF